MPQDPTKREYVFDGWYTERESGGTEFTSTTTVTGDIRVYAQWRPFNRLSLAEALTWISTNAATGETYTITLTNDETIGPRSLNYLGKTVNITLTGAATERTVTLRATGSLFTVENGVTLTLDNNVTLQGRSDNKASLVQVNTGGILVMQSGSKIRDNTYNYDYQGHVYAGGVYVNSGGTFTMYNGTISGNTASPYSSGSSYGGGVYVASNATFTMNNGTISGNTATLSSQGVGSFCVGGGVYVATAGTFTMTGGTISGNTASPPNDIGRRTLYSYGGGVHVARDGLFTMSGGTISGNTISTPASPGGSLSTSYGAGVYVDSAGTFTKEGGVIYGSDAGEGLKNTAISGDLADGHAVYVQSRPSVKIRNTTANESTTLDSASADNWEE
jgi:uncharacterized repeat protein (TIGR02543 family)